MNGAGYRFFHMATQAARISAQTTVIALGITVLDNLSRYRAAAAEVAAEGLPKSGVGMADLEVSPTPTTSMEFR